MSIAYLAYSERSGNCDYYFHSYYHTQAAPIISLTLDPQESLNCDLRIAAREGNAPRTLHLLSLGAKINGVSDDGQSALMIASETCNVQVGRLLLSKGAQLGLRDKYGRTALIYASMDSCSPMISTMTSLSGSEIRAQDKSGRSALDYAREGASLYEEGAPVDSVRLLKRALKLNSLHPKHEHSRNAHRQVKSPVKHS